MPGSIVSVPDIRDYQKINAELVQRLDSGAVRVRLAGAEGQRLLAAGLRGPWVGVVEVEGKAGPELAAGLDAPGLTVVALGPAADGAGRGLKAGRLLVLGEAGEALGYGQEGGAIVAARSAGARAGLNQAGGTLAVLGAVGRLAGERQSGGFFFAPGDRLGPAAGRGRRGGRMVLLATGGDDLGAGLDPDDARALREALDPLAGWLGRGGA